MREGATEDESPGLDADHHFDALALVMGGQQVDDSPKGGAVLEQGRDVLEEDAFGREVLDVPDLRAELSDVVHRAGILPARPAAHKAEGPGIQDDTITGVQCQTVSSCPPTCPRTMTGFRVLTIVAGM